MRSLKRVPIIILSVNSFTVITRWSSLVQKHIRDGAYKVSALNEIFNSVENILEEQWMKISQLDDRMLNRDKLNFNKISR